MKSKVSLSVYESLTFILNERIQIEKRIFLIMLSVWKWGTVFPVSKSLKFLFLDEGKLNCSSRQNPAPTPTSLS